MSVIKDQAVNTPAGRVQLAHSAFDLTSWSLHSLLEADKAQVSAGPEDTMPLTDDQAMALLSSTEQEGAFAACPISPTLALKLAAWLLKIAEIVIPALL